MHVTSELNGLAVVGGGRLGSALVTALPEADGPFGRGFDGDGYEVVLLAVPDRQIANAAATVRPGPLVGHCSGATRLDALLPHHGFSLHPLMTFSGDAGTSSPFAGAFAAVAGATAEAAAMARRLAEQLGMTPFVIADDDRAAYHAAASIASNLLVTLEDAAEQLLSGTGVEREVLVPLIRRTIDNWAADGRNALTGPVARGDEATIERQRQAIAERVPQLLPVFDVLVERTRRIASRD